MSRAAPGTGLLLLLLASVGRTQSPDADALFKQAFGKSAKPAAAPAELALPVDLEGSEIGTLETRMQGVLPVALKTQSLQALLQPLLEPATLEALQQAGAWVALDAPALAGVTLQYQPATLRFTLQLPLQARRNTRVSLGRRPANLQGLPPANFSAYSNFSILGDYVHDGRAAGWRQRSVAGTGALRLHGWVLDYAATISPGTGWAVVERRLVRDWPARGWRLQLGDLRLPTLGLLSAPLIDGMAWSSEDSLRPYDPPTPSLLAPLLLAQPAVVDIVQNGRVIESMRLPAGRYQLEDFPLLYGRNDVQIVATEDSGAVQRSDFGIYYDNDLLGIGQRRFAFAAGRSREDPDQTLLYTASVAQGVRDGLTLGLGMHAVPALQQQVLGLHSNISFLPFSAALGWAGSRQKETGVGMAARLGLQSHSGRDDQTAHWRWELGLGWRDDRWQPALARAPSGRGRELSVRLSRPLSVRDQLGLSLRALQTARRGSAGSLGLQWLRRIRGGWNLRVNLQQNRLANGSFDPGLELGLSYSFDEGRQWLSGVVNDELGGQLDWQWQPPAQAADWFVSASAYQDGHAAATLDSAISRSSDRASLTASHTAVLQGAAASRSRLSLDTAVVYADGALGLVERVTDSFAIFTVRGADQSVYIDPVEQAWAASSGGLGPAVLGTLTGYQPRGVVVQLPDWPIDQDPGELLPRLLPAYHSGHRVRLGSAAGCQVRMRLSQADGRAVELQPARLTDAGGTLDLPAFTDRAGHLETPVLAPGSYQLQLLRKPGWTQPVTVPVDCAQWLDLGEVSLP